MFVSELDIKEFRGIKNCKVPIKLTNFSVLLGKNSSGKSTILEALSLLPGPKINNYITSSSKLRYLQELHSSRLGDKSLLYLYAGTSYLGYRCKKNIIKIEIDEREVKYLYGKDSKLSNSGIAHFFNVDLKKLNQLVLFIPYSTSMLDVLEKKIGTLKELITKKGLHITLAKFLNKIVNDEYSELVFLDPISLRKVYSDNTAFIQLRDLGSGAEKVIKIMAFLEIVNPELVLIDDFEAGLHPTLVKLFIKWLKDHKWQTIISTHSIDVLYHLVDIAPTDTSILQLNKSNEDILSYEVLTLDELEDILDANTDPRLLLEALRL